MGYARQECMIQSQMKHENIVELYDYTENEKEIEIKIDQEHTGDRLLRLNKPEEGHKIFDKVVRKCEEREQLDSGDPMQSEEDNQDFQDTMNQEDSGQESDT